MKIHCFKCKVKFVPSDMNTQIIGPDVQITCPFCGYEYKGKLTSFVRDQINRDGVLSVNDARAMIDIAEFIELNSSDYYKKKGMRHGKKKVRNV